jgi:ABC-type glutathione transport system ATPase component
MLSHSAAPLLSVERLTKTYPARRSWPAAHQPEVQALRGVNLELRPQRRLAIVGASGSGKSTLARCIAGFEQPSSGIIQFDGRRLSISMLHHRIQMIFQDPGASLNPRFSVAEALEEPLVIRGEEFSRQDTADRLEQVGLAATMAERRTTQLSGGQKARLALARALAALQDGQPNVLILDESLSSLDLSTQAQIVRLLLDLQEPRQLAYIIIAHDLNLVQQWADEIVVMRDGQIVERGTPPNV